MVGPPVAVLAEVKSWDEYQGDGGTGERQYRRERG
jgi:hypothetical protein